MQTVQTSRFGTIEVDEHRVIHFPQGLLGFPGQKDYALWEDKQDSPFFWLQSLDLPELAFVLTNPFSFKNDYLQDLSPEEKTIFKNEHGDPMVLFALVTVPSGRPEKATINLLGPLVIDSTSRTGKQIILPDSGYSHRYPIFAR